MHGNRGFGSGGPIIRNTGANIMAGNRNSPVPFQKGPAPRSNSNSRNSGMHRRTPSVKSVKSPKISHDRFERHKQSNPFASSESKSAFAAAYTSRSLLCVLDSGSVHHTLRWTSDPSSLSYSQILPLFAEGVRETRHPYVTVARKGFTDLLRAPGSEAKVVPLLAQLTLSIRRCLMGGGDLFEAGCEALCQLSACVGPNLNSHLLQLIVPLKKGTFDKRHITTVLGCFNTLADNGGEEAVRAIKSKVPTFSFA